METAGDKCFFTEIMDYNYLVFLYFTTIITPAFILAVFYGLIYRVILKQVSTYAKRGRGGTKHEKIIFYEARGTLGCRHWL